MFKDVFFTPILINDFSDILQNLINKNINGIFNVSGKERISKYKFAVKLAKIFKFRSNLIKEISIKEVKLTRRPLDMSLDITKLKKTIVIKPKSINQSLRYLKKIINSNYYKKLKVFNYMLKKIYNKIFTILIGAKFYFLEKLLYFFIKKNYRHFLKLKIH